MAYVFNKGTRDNPNWHGRYKDGAGIWRMIKVPEEHASTKKAAQKWVDEKQEDVDAGRPDPQKAPTCGVLMETWLASLTNRNKADDQARTRKHLIPYFRDRRPAQIKTTDVVRWIDTFAEAKKPLSGSSQRQCVNLLSRFFGWAIARGHAEINPVRQLPQGERPRQAPKSQDAPWVKDDKQVLAIAGALPSPLGLMYLIGNRCGLRPGEVSGLRISDLDELAEGRIRVRHSEDGPLKEDKGDGPAPKVKWAPATPDVEQMLTSWIAKRTAAAAQPEDYLFPAADGRFVTKMQRSRAWRALPDELRNGMTWYEASRHSFASRNLQEGVPLEEVSGALGHSTPAVTLRHYSRFVRKDYSDGMRRALKITEGKVLPFVRDEAGASK